MWGSLALGIRVSSVWVAWFEHFLLTDFCELTDARDDGREAGFVSASGTGVLALSDLTDFVDLFDFVGCWFTKDDNSMLQWNY